jgi:phosphoglycolate phosphatase-like HAD superfamily hydrolase
VDSDGCVFDTMEAKQRRCFHPLIIEHWGLHAVADAVGETARFVNLYSRYRGGNRFPNLYLVFRLLADHPQVRGAGVALPDLSALRRLLDTDPAPSQDSLERAARATGDPSLVAVLAWSRAVNRRIAETMSEAPPFRHAVPALERLAATTDLVVVSQTPIEALTREWAASGLDRFVAWIGGQELGTKTEQIALAAHGRYAPGRVLMIGDAIGDLAAARANAAAFYPIRPGEEDASWQHFNAEAFDRFIAGRFAGPYEQALTAAFEAGLPERPPWRP